MGKDSKIQWTHHTFNPWWGCEKESPACAHCYAEAWAKRTGHTVWGAKAPRRFFGDKHWNEPLKWNRAAELEQANWHELAIAALADGEEAPEVPERPRVFCSSMADVFEDRPDLDEPRMRLMGLIDATPHLDWLLLTKRPQNIAPLMERITNGNFGEIWNFRDHLKNVWLGTTVEDQIRADQRIPVLAAIPATRRFLSCEPLLEPIRLWAGLPLVEKIPLRVKKDGGEFIGFEQDGPSHWERRDTSFEESCGLEHSPIHWVICGGESGGKARPLDLDWARDLRDQCKVAGSAFFMKQLGGSTDARGDIDLFPEDLRIREFPGLETPAES